MSNRIVETEGRTEIKLKKRDCALVIGLRNCTLYISKLDDDAPVTPEMRTVVKLSHALYDPKIQKILDRWYRGLGKGPKTKAPKSKPSRK